MKPNIWWILAKIRSFLVLETFPKKKNLQNHLKPPRRHGGFKLKILKPPWNHFGFTKKDNFPKSALKSYFDVPKNIIFFKIRMQIFLKFFEKNCRGKDFCQKLVRKARTEGKSIKNLIIFRTLKSQKGSFFTFWKTP